MKKRPNQNRSDSPSRVYEGERQTVAVREGAERCSGSGLCEWSNGNRTLINRPLIQEKAAATDRPAGRRDVTGTVTAAATAVTRRDRQWVRARLSATSQFSVAGLRSVDA